MYTILVCVYVSVGGHYKSYTHTRSYVLPAHIAQHLQKMRCDIKIHIWLA